MKGIYIHIPFCKKRCNYCDFCSYPSLIGRQEQYCRALADEAATYNSHSICADTVYFGGGTPTLLDLEQLAFVMDAINTHFKISPDAEITIEANPCTITPQKAKALRSMGFNRISLGAQSFVDSELAALGRTHSSHDIIKSFNILRDSGFTNISLDLMYAIPGQTLSTLSTCTEQVLNLAPEHISCYGLKIEENTPFDAMLSQGIISEKSDDEYADMYELIVSMLKSSGYCQYELSNFARQGFESKHNLKYWLGYEYVGLGASAASYYGKRRFAHTCDFDAYISSFENTEDYSLSQDDMMSEFMFLSLRLTSIGASKAEFESRFGKKADDVFADAISKHLTTGLLKDLGDRYVLSDRAYYVSNSILCDFV